MAMDPSKRTQLGENVYNAPDWLRRRADLSPHKVALIDSLHGDHPITYIQWNRSANQTAHFLRDGLGLCKGDRLAVLAKNCVEYLDIWFGLGKIGGVMQNLNWRLTSHELSGLIEDAEPIALVYGAEFHEQVHALRESLPSSIRMVSIGEPAVASDLSLSSRQEYPTTQPAEVDLSPEDPWVICYTGGTTGLPKGALLSHRSITANAINTIVSWGLSPEDVTILNSPLFHTGGLNVFTAPLVYLGGTSIVCQEFDLGKTFDLLETGGVTVWFGVPTMFIMMQNHPRWENLDLGALKFMISGGAPCPLPVFERFWEKGVDFKTGYGLTEAGPNTFWLPPEQVQEKPGAVGYPLFHVEVRIQDPEGQICDPGEIGELLIRGPHLFSGYWRQPRETAESMRDGWLHTGDLASFDEDGCYTIMGRTKDMIISGGENIYPAEIESALHAHPAVAEAALVPVPDDKWGQVGWAVVVSKPGEQIQQEALMDFLRQRLASYKLPKRVIFSQELPKTGANKVDKKRLVERYIQE